MSNLILKIFYARISEKNKHISSQNQHYAGFTLIEILVVVVMVGILSAIAAPGWIGFVNRQRVNKANDAVLSALQDAQQKAKKTKLSYGVSFKNDTSNIAQIAVHSVPSSGDDPTQYNWQPLGKDLNLKSGQILLGTNLSNTNTASSTSPSYNPGTIQSITFDYMGSLPNANFGTSTPPGLKIIVTAPKPGTITPGVKRCVIIRTLLGGMQTAKDASCD